MPRSFKLTNQKLIKSPNGNPFVYFQADIEYRYDEIHKPKMGSVTIQIAHEYFIFLGAENIAEKKLGYYAIEKLKTSFSVSNPSLEHKFEPNREEVVDLYHIDSDKIYSDENVVINEKMRDGAKMIFISCGQHHPHEKQLGKQIKQLIDQVNGFEGYFAENQQSFDGLTQNIFNALYSAAAFVAVMHRRDAVSGNDYRGSVWIEQEIAMAAFMVQTLKVPIEVKAYIQKGIKIEGVRGLIQLNPLVFEDDKEVIDDLKLSLPPLLAQIKPVDNWLIS